MYDNVTMVLTSCNRLDLLERTIKSIPSEILSKIPKKILVDDSANGECFSRLTEDNQNGYLKGWTLLLNGEKLGQAGSIDRAYSEVETEYVFHCEDDWGFEEYDFITPSIKILEKYDNLVQVTFRKDTPHLTHDELYEEGTDCAFRVMIPGYNGWPGFTYNPNVFRFSAYKKLEKCIGMSEKDVGIFYKDNQLYTAALEKRIVYHLGDGRHVYDSIGGV
jgi:hypothetical protein